MADPREGKAPGISGTIPQLRFREVAVRSLKKNYHGWLLDASPIAIGSEKMCNGLKSVPMCHSAELGEEQ